MSQNLVKNHSQKSEHFSESTNTGYFFHWYPPKKLKYGKPRLGESTLT